MPAAPELRPDYTIGIEGLAQLIACLQQRGYVVIGPIKQDGAILYNTIEKIEDLPAGWSDDQAPGQYRLKKRTDGALFGYSCGPHSWKKLFHPAEIRLFQIERNGQIRADGASEAVPKYALLGARACDLAAIAIQDRVLLGDRYSDPIYAERRRSVFVVAVQCTQASSSCFCASLGTGPKAKNGFDLALTEIVEPNGSYFVVQAATAAGEDLLGEVKARPATEEESRKAEAAVAKAESLLTRRMETAGIRELLYERFDHPRWEDAAKRCLSCGNCTMVCPTCFCVTVEDTSDVTGDHAERWRRWDSCFVQNFSYIHGGSVRTSVKSRYRQWVTHKLAAWQDQFGMSGCVGCGRCITWCPVGIDVTEEITAIRGTKP
jgi:ferredoxin